MALSESPVDGKARGSQSPLKSLRLFLKDGILKRTGSSYIALFRPLQDTQSRSILFCAVALAIAAGAPLPIIGVIFARIIDSFPPSEDEIRTRVSQLLAVGEFVSIDFLFLLLILLTPLAIAYFVVTWGWAFCWGIVGTRVSRGLRTQMVDRALGLDQTYYETICPDVSRHTNHT